MHGEHGGVILSGLLRTAAWLIAFSILAFDTGGIVTNRVLLDEAGRVAARHAAEAVTIATSRGAVASRDAASTAAATSLRDQPGVELTELHVDERHTVLVLRRRARVLLADRLPFLDRHVAPVVTATATIAP